MVPLFLFLASVRRFAVVGLLFLHYFALLAWDLDYRYSTMVASDCNRRANHDDHDFFPQAFFEGVVVGWLQLSVRGARVVLQARLRLFVLTLAIV